MQCSLARSQLRCACRCHTSSKGVFTYFLSVLAPNSLQMNISGVYNITLGGKPGGEEPKMGQTIDPQ